MHFDVVIVGAGHGGAQVAVMLRTQKFEGSIAIVGDEPELPYERPPLSKEYFAGEKEFERIQLRPAKYCDERDVTMLLGKRVVSVDSSAHRVTTDGGETIGYGKLVWATGGRPRMLPIPGGDLPGVQGVRTRADADAMKAAAETAKQIVVIGGGYIGLEAAAVLTKAGKKVVLLEALDRVLARVAGEPLSRFYEQEHRDRGVDLRLGVSVTAIEGGDHVTGVRLSDGEVIPADLVIVGIGILPNVELTEAAGLPCDNGIVVDEYCRTSDADILAVGDCTNHPNALLGKRLRLESVHNAQEQAKTAADTILGKLEPYAQVPWFWSDQYDLKLQFVGMSAADQQVVVRGDPESRSFAAFYLDEGRLAAVYAINSPREFMLSKKLIAGGARPDRAVLRDMKVPFREIAESLGD